MNECAICGCTDLRACVSTDGEPCSWALETPYGPVCSACVLTPIAIIPPAMGARAPLCPPLELPAREWAFECDLCGGDGCPHCYGSGVSYEDVEYFSFRDFAPETFLETFR